MMNACLLNLDKGRDANCGVGRLSTFHVNEALREVTGENVLRKFGGEDGLLAKSKRAPCCIPTSSPPFLTHPITPPSSSASEVY